MFQYAITPVFLMIGFMFHFSHNLGVEDAKKLLLAFIIAYLPLIGSFYLMASSTNSSNGSFPFCD
jgi:hypothetical protein